MQTCVYKNRHGILKTWPFFILWKDDKKVQSNSSAHDHSCQDAYSFSDQILMAWLMRLAWPKASISCLRTAMGDWQRLFQVMLLPTLRNRPDSPPP